MSTRGLYGIRKNGVDKCTYNHYDSYPEGLGADVVEFIKVNSDEELERFFDLIKLVEEDSKPTEAEKRYCAKYYDGYVSTKSENDWYCLLRNLQGNFLEYKQLIDEHRQIYMTNGIDFIKDSLFCEYAYIINLDEHCLEFWLGFQKEPDAENRYGQEHDHDYNNSYYPCKLVSTYSLEEVRTATDGVVTDMQKKAGYDDEE